ncbi:unnamed protein product [Microthlaspi erraticum]|uniref:Auxin response factor domain-containing protein n=1 Tax=Microthlaspi erraticum TaxID=1685480 RepID=A0A6D2J1J6_9BRAS|nr:unnamed protein product [Microthlaspi erraticum]
MDHLMQFNVDLPSKIPCHVSGYQLEVDKDTDEVYTKITLMPDSSMKTAIPIPNNVNRRFPVVRSFTKVLTTSDTNGHSGLSVLRRHATECLPPLVYGLLFLTAKNAINSPCMFTVVYKPRSSQFVISYEKYLDAVNNKVNVGSRFKMHFEGEDLTERRCFGTIKDVKDYSPNWNDSKWRSVEVQWEEQAVIPKSNKISPWEIEDLLPSTSVFQSALLKNKRPRQDNEIGSTSLNLWTPTLTQGQEIGQSSKSYPISVAQLSYDNSTEDPKIPSGWLMSSCEVQMHGLSLCRAIDLTVLDGYNALMKELDKIFDLKGELCAGHLWEIVYIDNEGDMMLVGEIHGRKFPFSYSFP